MKLSIDINFKIFEYFDQQLRQWRIFSIRKPAGIKWPHSSEWEMTKMFSGLRIKKMRQGYKVQGGNS